MVHDDVQVVAEGGGQPLLGQLRHGPGVHRGADAARTDSADFAARLGRTPFRSGSCVAARGRQTGLARASVNSTRPRRGSAELNPSTARIPARGAVVARRRDRRFAPRRAPR